MIDKDNLPYMVIQFITIALAIIGLALIIGMIPVMALKIVAGVTIGFCILFNIHIALLTIGVDLLFWVVQIKARRNGIK